MTTLPAPDRNARLVERIKNILLRPKTEWPIIAAEPASVGSIYSAYVVYVAAVPVLCALIGGVVVGHQFAGLTERVSFFGAIWTAALQYAFQLGGVYVFALIIDALAPRFEGTSDKVRAFKLAAYSATASWLAGVFALVPALSFLSIVGVYSLYLLYTGVPVLMRVPERKALPFTATIVGIGIVLTIVAGLLLAAFTPALGPAPEERGGGKAALPGGDAVGMSTLEEATKRLEYITKQLEASQQTEVDGNGSTSSPRPVEPEDLKGLLPDELAGGYRRDQVSTSSGGAGTFSIVTARAQYTKDDATIDLTLSDIGAVGALASLGTIFGAHAKEETETSYSTFGEVDGRMTAESYNRETGSGSYTVLVGERILVEAKGDRASMTELKESVNAVGTAPLEALLAAP
jgi:Yip1 domain